MGKTYSGMPAVVHRPHFKEQFLRPVFLKLGSGKGYQGFRETKMRNGERVLLLVQKLYVRIKIAVATFDTNHSDNDNTQTIIYC